MQTVCPAQAVPAPTVRKPTRSAEAGLFEALARQKAAQPFGGAIYKGSWKGVRWNTQAADEQNERRAADPREVSEVFGRIVRAGMPRATARCLENGTNDRR